MPKLIKNWHRMKFNFKLRFLYGSKISGYVNKKFAYSETLSEIVGDSSIDLKGWNQWYYGEQS